MREQYKPLSNFEIMEEVRKISNTKGNIPAKPEYATWILSMCRQRGLSSSDSPFRKEVLECSERYNFYSG
ncbi:hypothetical protein HY449_01755 [Candidatus Pacearchaeota archaeon]|nr:hypothetical protein [Candidatus Pacearchaeota archaeon]